MATPSFVQVPPDGTGKKIDNTVVTTTAGTVERQVVVVADPANPSGYAGVSDVEPAGSATGLVVRPIPASTAPLPTGAATDATLSLFEAQAHNDSTALLAGQGTDGATPPAIPGTGVRGWLRSIYERLGGTLLVDGSAHTQPVSVAGTVTVATPHLNSASDSVTAVPTGTQIVDGSAVTQPISAAALPLPAGAALASTQTDGTQRTQVTNPIGSPVPVSVVTGTVSVTNINALAVVEALNVSNFDLAAAPYSGAITSLADYLLSTIKMGFSTAASRTVTISAGSRKLFTQTFTDLDVLLDFEGLPFDATETVSVAVTQTGSACLLTSLIANIEQGSAALGGNPILGGGTAHIGSVSIDTANASSGDAFGRLRVSEPYTLLDTVHSYDLSPLYWDTVTASGGTVTSTPLLSGATLATTTTSGSRAVFQTHAYLRYQPGKGQALLATGVLGPKTTNVARRIGYYDDNDGVFFEVTGTDIAVVRRTSTSGTSVDNRVVQSAWNQDKLDGTGPSGLVLDTTKMQIFTIDFQWLSIGQIRYGVEINGQIIFCHIAYHANVLTVPYMRTATLPVRYELVNTGTAAGANSLLAVCSTVLTEGGRQEVGNVFGVDTGTTLRSCTSATPVPVLAIRPAATFQSIPNRITVIPSGANVNTAQNLILRVYYRAVLTGASWVAVDSANSTVEYDLSATAMAGGVCVYSDIVAGKTAVQPAALDLGKLVLALSASGIQTDTLVIAMAKISTNANDITAALTWEERR